MKRVFLSMALGASMIAAGIPAVAQTATTDQGANQGTSGTTSTAPEYGKHHRRGHRGMGFQKMSQKLNLSQSQQDQFKTVFQQSQEQAKAIRNDASLTADQKKEKLEALHQNTKTQVNGLLTPDQQKQFAEMKAEGKQRMAGRKEMMGKRMAEKLSLSQQQQDQLKPIFEGRREQAKAIWQDNSLTQDQKKEKMQALHESTQAQVKGILTPEQQQQWQQMRENFKQHRHHRGAPTDQSTPVPQA